MRELAILIFMTVDGVMQAPGSPAEDRSGGFDQGGWAARYWEGVMAHVQRTAMAEPYDILLGRKTYDLFASYWPNAPQSHVSEQLNNARKYVVTSSPLTNHWQHSEVLNGDLAGDVQRLKSEDGPLLQVHGSAELTHALLAHGLVDEMRLWTFPVLVGGGKRVFDGSNPAQGLTRVSAEALENGVSASIYRKAA
ncbi:MAG: dihydrofolate reductase family protein [Cohaesibacteraceae bacterium]